MQGMDTTIAIFNQLPEIVTGKKHLSFRCYVEGKKAYFFFKRITDIALSVFMIVFVLSWLFPLIALLLKLDSPGPVFFLQKRVGKGGRSFTCYKFRTMVVNKEAHYRQATRNDRRITRLGKLLRTTNIDELPQFLNVLLGHMSIVGPRPHMYADCRQFGVLIPRYKLRNLVKPGITGIAQVNGYHGPVPDYDQAYRRYQWDIFYVRNAGAWLDTRIMVRTVLQHLRLLFPS
jgi:putative colanic acid biosynthesis UDP-glucose lipid carrier transferase